MKFIVATPSFNNLTDLRKCIGSVRAQARTEPGCESAKVKRHEGNLSSDIRTFEPSHSDGCAISIEHIVQDGGSEGFPEFASQILESEKVTMCEGKKAGASQNLPTFPPSHLPTYQLQMHSEADSGMYDAINKAWEKGEGDVYSWLNCDEQYLPGTLAKVARYFEKHSEIDAVCGNYIVVDADGHPLAARRDIPLRKAYITNGFLYAGSCTCFYRKRLRDRGLLKIDSSFRYSADADFVLRLLDAGVRFGRIDDYLSLFGVGGDNLSFSREMDEESEAVKSKYGRSPYPLARKAWMACRHGERLMRGCYRREDVTYAYAINERPEYEKREASRLNPRFEFDWYRSSEAGTVPGS
jgi:hypothetical protein